LSHDVERFLSLFTDDMLCEDVARGTVFHGRGEYRPFGEAFFVAFPDAAFELTSSGSRFAAGSHGVVEWVMRGTHRGDMPGMPATDKRVEVRGASIVEFAGGRICRCSDYWDRATALKQIGFMPTG
jgi:steroid delta-isomerase-like uncharacterized protein